MNLYNLKTPVSVPVPVLNILNVPVTEPVLLGSVPAPGT